MRGVATTFCQWVSARATYQGQISFLPASKDIDASCRIDEKIMEAIDEFGSRYLLYHKSSESEVTQLTEASPVGPIKIGVLSKSVCASSRQTFVPPHLLTKKLPSRPHRAPVSQTPTETSNSLRPLPHPSCSTDITPFNDPAQQNPCEPPTASPLTIDPTPCRPDPP